MWPLLTSPVTIAAPIAGNETIPAALVMRSRAAPNPSLDWPRSQAIASRAPSAAHSEECANRPATAAAAPSICRSNRMKSATDSPRQPSVSSAGSMPATRSPACRISARASTRRASALADASGIHIADLAGIGRTPTRGHTSSTRSASILEAGRDQTRRPAHWSRSVARSSLAIPIVQRKGVRPHQATTNRTHVRLYAQPEASSTPDRMRSPSAEPPRPHPPAIDPITLTSTPSGTTASSPPRRRHSSRPT